MADTGHTEYNTLVFIKIIILWDNIIFRSKNKTNIHDVPDTTMFQDRKKVFF